MPDHLPAGLAFNQRRSEGVGGGGGATGPLDDVGAGAPTRKSGGTGDAPPVPATDSRTTHRTTEIPRFPREIPCPSNTNDLTPDLPGSKTCARLVHHEIPSILHPHHHCDHAAGRCARVDGCTFDGCRLLVGKDPRTATPSDRLPSLALVVVRQPVATPVFPFVCRRSRQKV